MALGVRDADAYICTHTHTHTHTHVGVGAGVCFCVSVCVTTSTCLRMCCLLGQNRIYSRWTHVLRGFNVTQVVNTVKKFRSVLPI